MDVTIHYIDSSFTLVTFTLGFIHLKSKHSGENIATELKTIFDSWGLTDSVLCCVLDNASNNTTAVSSLWLKCSEFLPFYGAHLHGRCNAHILNLLAQDALSILKFTLSKLRTMIKFVSTPKQRELFEVYVKQYDAQLTDIADKLEKIARPFLDCKTR